MKRMRRTFCLTLALLWRSHSGSMPQTFRRAGRHVRVIQIDRRTLDEADFVGVDHAWAIGKVIDHFSWEVVLYALLSLTLIRMLPVFLSLAGTSLRADEKLFIGWFGPRGLASVVFAVIVFNEHLPGGGTIVVTVVCTVALSVLTHGLSAKPLIAALAARIRRSDGKISGDQ